jgi:hypothetical protein
LLAAAKAMRDQRMSEGFLCDPVLTKLCAAIRAAEGEEAGR